jgi:hypothetical protein
MAKTKTRAKGKKAPAGISHEVWEWAKANPWYECLIKELEDFEDLRREKSKKGKGTPFTDVLKEYETAHHVQIAR